MAEGNALQDIQLAKQNIYDICGNAGGAYAMKFDFVIGNPPYQEGQA